MTERLELQSEVEAEPATGGWCVKRWRLALLLAALLIAVVAGSYFHLVRTAPAVIEASLSSRTVVSGGEATISGVLRPSSPIRVVTLERELTRGTWDVVGQAAQSDPSGRFSISFTPTAAGSHPYRVRTNAIGRLEASTSEFMPLTVLELSAVDLQAPGAVELGHPLALRSTTTPPVPGRTVVLQTSTDAETWVNTSARGVTDASGTYVAEIFPNKAGPVLYRAMVQADGRYAAGEGPPVAVAVEDVKSAREHYLKMVEPANVAAGAFYDVLGDQASSLSQLTTAAAASAAATRSFTDGLDQYPAWPGEVMPLVERFVELTTEQYGHVNQLAGARSLNEFNSLYNAGPDYTESANLAEKIRQKLGLPARPNG